MSTPKSAAAPSASTASLLASAPAVATVTAVALNALDPVTLLHSLWVETLTGNGDVQSVAGSLATARVKYPHAITVLSSASTATGSTATLAIGESNGFRTLTLATQLRAGTERVSGAVSASSALSSTSEELVRGCAFASATALLYLCTKSGVWSSLTSAVGSSLTAASATLVAGHVTKTGDNDRGIWGVRFNDLRGMCLDADGVHLLLCDSGAHKLKRLDTRSREVITVAGDGKSEPALSDRNALSVSLPTPRSVALVPPFVAGDAQCDVLIACGSYGVRRLNRRTNTLHTVTLSPNVQPHGLCFTPSGWLIGSTASSLHLIDLRTSPALTYRIAGHATKQGFADGKAVDAKFDSPVRLALWDNRLIVSDYGNHRLRIIALPPILFAPPAPTLARGIAASVDNLLLNKFPTGPHRVEEATSKLSATAEANATPELTAQQTLSELRTALTASEQRVAKSEERAKVLEEQRTTVLAEAAKAVASAVAKEAEAMAKEAMAAAKEAAAEKARLDAKNAELKAAKRLAEVESDFSAAAADAAGRIRSLEMELNATRSSTASPISVASSAAVASPLATQVSSPANRALLKRLDAIHMELKGTGALVRDASTAQAAAAAETETLAKHVRTVLAEINSRVAELQQRAFFPLEQPVAEQRAPAPVLSIISEPPCLHI